MTDNLSSIDSRYREAKFQSLVESQLLGLDSSSSRGAPIQLLCDFYRIAAALGVNPKFVKYDVASNQEWTGTYFEPFIGSKDDFELARDRALVIDAQFGQGAFRAAMQGICKDVVWYK